MTINNRKNNINWTIPYLEILKIICEVQDRIKILNFQGRDKNHVFMLVFESQEVLIPMQSLFNK